MNIIVKKPTEDEITEMQSKPTWSCDIPEFDYVYDCDETCLIVEGDATVEHDGGSVRFGAGDLVVFPEGLSCKWKIAVPVKKHYVEVRK